jgi:hypothetical protein
MGFRNDYRYSSYNSLTVPLDIGTWECTLLLRSEYDQQTWWRQSARERDRRSQSEWNAPRWRRNGSVFDRDDDPDAADQRRRDEDQRAFLQYFRPNYDFRQLIATDIRAITSFLSHHLNVPHWDLPTDNAGIERQLKQAVKDNKLVPVVNRDYRNTPRTFRPAPAPLSWLSSSGAGVMGGSASLFPPGTTSHNGEQVLSGPYDAASQAALLATLRGASGDGDIGGGNSVNNTSTLFGEAQPFEYTEDLPAGDVEELAASTNNPNYAAKMLGYERKIFGNMVHTMKDENELRGDDNVIWHDNGDVSFNGVVIDNMHNY